MLNHFLYNSLTSHQLNILKYDIYNLYDYTGLSLIITPTCIDKYLNL